MRLNVRKIVVPVDFSAISDRLTAFAASLAGKLGAEIHLVHVIDEVLTPELTWAPAKAAAAQCERLEQGAGWKLDVYVRLLQQQNLRATCEARVGLPTDEIVTSAAAAGADLIVMTTHTFVGNGRPSSSSVADHVVRHAHCPVLTVGEAVLETAGQAKERMTPCA